MDVRLFSVVACVSIAAKSPYPICILSSATKALCSGANVWDDTTDTCESTSLKSSAYIDSCSLCFLVMVIPFLMISLVLIYNSKFAQKAEMKG